MKKMKMEEEEKTTLLSSKSTKGQDFNLNEFIKPEYLIQSQYLEIKVPSKVEYRIAAHKQEATCLTFNAMGDIMATGGADCLVKLWSVSSGKEMQQLRGFNRAVTDVSISMDNELIAAASTEHKALIWSMKTMRVIHTFTGHKETINASKFSFVTRSLLTGS